MRAFRRAVDALAEPVVLLLSALGLLLGGVSTLTFFFALMLGALKVLTVWAHLIGL